MIDDNDIDGEGTRDRDSGTDVRRLLIPPRYINTFVHKFNLRTGERLTEQDRRDDRTNTYTSRSKDQGTCGTC
jgi:hypothetical protein